MRRDNIRLIIVFIQVLLIAAASAYSSGAPEEACSNMSPKHQQYPKQSTDSPYNISMSSESYYPGQTITVKIEGSDFLKGLILQARQTGGRSEIPEGRFDRLPETLQYLTCNNKPNSTVTHVDSSDKPLIEVDWIAPQEFVGKIRFYATIVRNVSTYWKGVRSKRLTEQHATTDVQFITEIVDLTLVSGANSLQTTEHSTTENEKYVETSPPGVFHSATLGTSNRTASLIDTTPDTTTQSSESSSYDITTPDTKPLRPESSTTSSTTTVPVSIHTDLPPTKSTTLDYSVSSNFTTSVTDSYETNQSSDHVTEKYNITEEPSGTQIAVSERSAMASITEDYTNFDQTTTNQDVTTTPLESTTSNNDVTYDRTLSTRTTQTTDYEFHGTRLTSDGTTSALSFTPILNGSNTSESHISVSELLTDLPTHALMQETDLTTETSHTTSDDLTGNYSNPTESTTSAYDVINESHAEEHIPMVTNYVDSSVFFKMTITSLEFTESLLDRTSEDFMELSDDIQNTMEEIYASWEGFRECKIVDFTPGSVISETQLVFEGPLSEEEKATTVGEVYTLVEENGSIGNYSVSGIQAVNDEGTYVMVDPCFLLPCPTNLNCYVQESKCILTCEENTDFCPNGECEVNDNGKNLTCNNDVAVEPTSNKSHEMVIALVLICVSVFLVVLALVLFVFICKLWKKRRRRRLRQNRDLQQPFGFENNKHIRLNGGVQMTNFSGSRGRYLVEIAEPIETPFFSRHPTDLNLISRGSIGSVDQHSIFDRAFSSAPQSDLDEHDYDYDVISRNRSVTFSETPQILGDDQSAEEVFGIENFSFGVPKYVDREDDGGSYRVRWDFKVDDPDTDMDIAL